MPELYWPVGRMTATKRQNLLLILAGLVFLAAGFRDRFLPGFLTFNRAVPSREDVAIAMTLGLAFLAVAAFRMLKTKSDV
jgi:hypothetical protein